MDEHTGRLWNRNVCHRALVTSPPWPRPGPRPAAGETAPQQDAASETPSVPQTRSAAPLVNVVFTGKVPDITRFTVSFDEGSSQGWMWAATVD